MRETGPLLCFEVKHLDQCENTSTLEEGWGWCLDDDDAVRHLPDVGSCKLTPLTTFDLDRSSDPPEWTVGQQWIPQNWGYTCTKSKGFPHITLCEQLHSLLSAVAGAGGSRSLTESDRLVRCCQGRGHAGCLKGHPDAIYENAVRIYASPSHPPTGGAPHTGFGIWKWIIVCGITLPSRACRTLSGAICISLALRSSSPACANLINTVIRGFWYLKC